LNVDSVIPEGITPKNQATNFIVRQAPRAAYYPQTTPYNINNFPAARNQHTKAVKQHTLAT
jgi:hypothetical protein